MTGVSLRRSGTYAHRYTRTHRHTRTPRATCTSRTDSTRSFNRSFCSLTRRGSIKALYNCSLFLSFPIAPLPFSLSRCPSLFSPLLLAASSPLYHVHRLQKTRHSIVTTGTCYAGEWFFVFFRLRVHAIHHRFFIITPRH